MARGSYQLTIIDPVDGSTIDIIPAGRLFNMKYSRELTSIGKLSVALPARRRDWIGMIPVDALLEVRRFANGTETVEGVYFARKFNRISDGIQERVVISGSHITSLLQRRIVDPERDPQAAGGYSTKTGAAGGVIREYVQEQFSGTGFVPDFSVPEPDVDGIRVGADLRYENLFDEIQKLAKRGQVDIEIRRVNGRELELYIGRIGTNQSLATRNFPPYSVFSPQRRNIANPRLTLDYTSQHTVVYALGDGDGENRDVLRVSLNSEISPYGVNERKIDVRNSNKGDDVSLLTAANARLIELQAKQDFEFDLITGRAGVIYQKDWGLGDSFTVQWDNYRANLRVVTVTVSLNSGTEEIKPEVKIIR